MADYPNWVMKHKKKGTYINKVNDKYYLYAAHSERKPGTKIVRRVSDGYIGRITEEDGLIPARDKVKGTVQVFEFGMSATILNLCKKIHSGLKRTFKSNADYIMVASILSVIHGRYDNFCYEHSYLSILFGDIDFMKEPTQKQAFAIERGVLMIRDTLSTHFKEDLSAVLFHFQNCYKVKTNGKFYVSQEPAVVLELKEKHHIDWEEYNG